MIKNLQSYLIPCISFCWRVVETQEKAATRDITDSADEQARLEALLDQIKPALPNDCQGLSYLLMTPFRYPPLRHGSRFGTPWERGIFYGSTEIETAFAESAVYFWLFQNGPETLGSLENIRDHRTVFSIRLASQRVMQLESAAFDDHREKIMNPASWEFTQQLGASLREINVDFVSYPSARLPKGRNIAVFSPSCFSSAEPEDQQHWNVRLTYSNCWFSKPDGTSYEFYRKDFEAGDKAARYIPHPSLLTRAS